MKNRSWMFAGVVLSFAAASGAGCSGPAEPESTETTEGALITCPRGMVRKCAYSPDVRRVECECVPAPPPIPTNPQGLGWPIACTPGVNCTIVNLPDPDNNGIAYNCSRNSIVGHSGVDVVITWAQMDAGVDVTAAADGEVVFVADGKYDRCPNPMEPDCTTGTTVCTPACGPGVSQPCNLCMAGGNVVLIRHDAVPGVTATRYDHFKKNSITVRTGDRVTRGQVIGKVGSAGNSSDPHLHFDVWSNWGVVVDPWVSSSGCGTNTTQTLWLIQNK